MPSTVEITGRAASPGIAVGHLVRLDDAPAVARTAGSPDEEAVALTAAISGAIAGLANLMHRLDGPAAAIVAFQIAMLEDDELSAAAFTEISQGRPADEAWLQALNVQVNEYQTAEDEYFQARAADLKDLRDRVLNGLTGKTATVAGAGAVLAGDDITPTRFLETDWREGGGIILAGGSAASHVAMLARSRGVPMVVGLQSVAFDRHESAAVDGATGQVVLSPDKAKYEQFRNLAEAQTAANAEYVRFAAKPAISRDGVAINVLINVASADELDMLDVAVCDGIGLMRTEFLFQDPQGLPDEDTQYQIYRRLIEWADSRPVTIRTLDAGGDKPVPNVTLDGETNTFMGTRGIRLSFVRDDLFRIQLRALARAAVHGPLKVMWPMITLPHELGQASALFDEELARLEADGVASRRPNLGMMVEVPAAAIAPDLFSAADFFSIGSNDLSQYVAAASRDNGAVGHLIDGVAPVVVRLIEGLARYCEQQSKELSICGDMASDSRHVGALLRAGLRNLSVAPSAVGRVKAEIAGLELGAAHGRG